jgi:lysophospholipase L1-like esterase
MSPGAPAAGVPRRRRRRWFLPFAVVLVLAVIALGTELAFRLFWRMPPVFAEFEQAGLYVQTADGTIGFAPGYRGTLAVGGMRTEVAINTLGMRGAEIGSKQPGERRVLVVGDSLVFGYGVQAGEALPQRLQESLASNGVAVTAGNGGMPGIGTRDAAARMQQLDAPFGPDAFVFCCYLGNDAVDDLRIDRAVCGGLRFDGPMARLSQSSWRMQLAVRSRAMLWFEAWVFTNHPTSSPLLQMAPSAEELASMAGLPGDYPAFAGTYAGLFLDVADVATTWKQGAPPVLPRVLGNVRASLQRAKAIAGARPLLFVLLPTRWQLADELWTRQLKQMDFHPASFRRGAAQRRFAGVAQELGIPAFDATPVLAAERDQAGLFVDDGGHFSGRGNEVVAKSLAAQLVPLLK